MRFKKVIRLGFISLSLLILASLGLVVVLVLVQRDIEPPDTSDLVGEVREVADEDNALTYIKAACDALDLAQDDSAVLVDYRKGDPVDDAWLVNTFTVNDQACELLLRAAQCEACIAPLPISVDQPLTVPLELIQLCKLVAAKIRHEAVSGNHAAATSMAVALHRLGWLIQRDANVAITYLIGNAVMVEAGKEMVEVARQPEVSSTLVVQMIPEIQGVSLTRKAYIEAMKGEYHFSELCVDLVLRAHREGNSDMVDMVNLPRWVTKVGLFGYVFHPNRTRTLFADGYRQAIAASALPYEEAIRCLPEDELAERNRILMLMSPNSVGKLLVGLGASVGNPRIRCKTEYQRESIRVALALHAHRIEHGGFPESLDALVGSHLDAVPADPYDGKPMRYSREQGVVFSVGEDSEEGTEDDVEVRLFEEE